MYKGTLLLDHFRDFYRMVAQSLAEQESTPQLIFQPLLEKLQQQRKTIYEYFIGEDREELLRGLYLQASLADELFLHQWEDRSFWEKNMLEHQMFQSQNAGMQIPQEMAHIIQYPQHYSREIIQLYYWTLALGFCGGLEEKMIRQLKRKCMTLLYPDDAFLLTQKQRFLMPQALDRVVAARKIYFRHDVQWWWYGWGVFFLLFTIVTAYFWYDRQQEIYAMAEKLYAKTAGKRSLW